MHDCVKTNELLVDLVFGELGPESRARALVEVEGCHDCLAQYRSMTEALRLFDQAAEIAAPEESYWSGYETRLSERLRNERPGWTRRLANWIGGAWTLTMRPIPVAAGLALALLSIGWWMWQRRQVVAPLSPYVATQTPAPQPKIEPKTGLSAKPPKPGGISGRRTPVHSAAAKSNGKAPSVRREEPDAKMVEDLVAVRSSAGGSDRSLSAASLFTPETIRHFEKAQLMLRSFRNASAAKSLAATDLAYERQLSRRLLYQNILLRRESERNGNLPAEEALSGLEPFLLDIANLPDRPSPGELGGIRERLQRKELIASLQISSARPSTPAYQIP